ncbi:MAG: calcium-translocating P-type ATPase, PMCA-type [Ignavibacteria bacterium]|nr:calcium-translocating P-type ATPase, PMCA-type [Ignavibacteria bacterium]
MNIYNLNIKDSIKSLDSSDNGLSSQEAVNRLSKFGKNELTEKKKKPVWILFLEQFKDFMILVLIAAAVISGIIGDLTDTVIILIIVILNALIGFIQEYRAEKAMEALKKLATLKAEVLRNGKPLKISSSELVPGDVVLLEAGNAVPADLRLIESNSLRIDESALTGESVASDKIANEIDGEDISLGDRLNMAYKGTLITNGRGKGLVTETGMNTEIGTIAKMLQEEGTITPLQKRMADFGKKLSYIILLICAMLFGIGLLRGEEPMHMLLISISLAVAAIPEALPALVTISLALGAKRLVKQNALIRKLPAVETLGSVTYICSDKTGTLTVNRMKVLETFEAENSVKLFSENSLLFISMALNNDVKISTGNKLSGDPTEIALAEVVIHKNGIEDFEDIKEHFPRVAELPFDSERKCMTTVHKTGDEYLIVTKGAVENVTAKLVSTDDNKNITLQAEEWAKQGLRVLCFAYKIIDKLPEPFSFETVETDLIFAGLAGMIDPPREEAKLAIQECRTAGIKPVMITGDHPSTAAAIAKEIGIYRERDYIVSGKELQKLSDKEFEDKVEYISVYARVSPEQKLKIVKALQNKDHFIAMTGDGVNDAPSLKSADIGIAMGINGTDVSKEASEMILLDDNFATIVKAVREGRRIYDNIRKFVKYIMTCNSAEIWTIFLAPVIGLPMPLLPIHILWINLVTDGLPGLALAGEQEEKDIMKRPPRKSDESLFADGIGYHIIWVGLLMAGITLAVQAYALNTGDENWQTMVFTVLSLSQLGHVLAIRSDREFIYQKGIFSNPPLLGAITLTFILQLAVIYLPFANKVFKTQPLSIEELALCIIASGVVFHAVEFEKWVKSKMKKK